MPIPRTDPFDADPFDDAGSQGRLDSANSRHVQGQSARLDSVPALKESRSVVGDEFFDLVSDRG